jgi:hypothetical protein
MATENTAMQMKMRARFMLGGAMVVEVFGLFVEDWKVCGSVLDRGGFLPLR